VTVIDQSVIQNIQTVVIIGPKGYIASELVAGAFKRQGLKVALFEWNFPTWKTGESLTRLITGGKKRKSQLKERFNEALSKALDFDCSTEQSLLFAIMPNELNDRNRDALSTWQGSVVQWAIDSLSRYPDQTSLCPYANHSLLVDGGDVGCDSDKWMPMGYDPRIFRPVSLMDGKYDFDVAFVGNISGHVYSTRRRYLKRLRASKLCGKYRVAFVGSSGSRLESRTRWMPGRINWLATSLSQNDLARVIRRSRILINIHQDDGKMPVNPMFLAGSAAGCCQMAEPRDYLSRWLRPGRDYYPLKEESFEDDLQYLLENESLRNSIAETGAISSRKYTIDVQMKQVLSSVSRNS